MKTAFQPGAAHLLALLSTVCLLAGCGQRGPLYLPSPSPSAPPAIVEPQNSLSPGITPNSPPINVPISPGPQAPISDSPSPAIR